MQWDANDIEKAARTAYGEASGAGDAARIGVISSVLNRVRDGHFPGGGSVAGVCTAHMQYDCWNAGTPDFDRMMRASVQTDPSYAACYGLALVAAQGLLPDNTHGAVFYHDVSLPAAPRKWGNVHLTAVHGPLKFYAPAEPARAKSN